MNIYSIIVLGLCAAIAFISVPISSAAINRRDVDGLIRLRRDHGQGITGPVHTYVKTDKHANFKWGVRHHVGKHYAGH